MVPFMHLQLPTTIMEFMKERHCGWSPFFVKETAAVALTARLSVESRSSHGSVKEGTLTTYVQAVNHLLETYSTNDIIAEAYTEIVRFTQRTHMSSIQCADAL